MEQRILMQQFNLPYRSEFNKYIGVKREEIKN